MATGAGRGATGGPRVVLVQQIAVAHFLERSQIVRSSENYRLDVMSNDWWGEPLAAMLSRVLIEELGQRLPQSTVIADNGAVSARPDATVEVNIQRLDEDAAGNLVLQAQVAVRATGQTQPGLRSFRFCAAAAGAGRAGRGRGDQRRGRPARRRHRADADGTPGRAGDNALPPAPPADPAAAARMPGLRAVAAGPGAHPRHLGAIARAARRSCAGFRAHRLDHMAALTVAALVLLVVMCSSALMSVETAGIRHVADLFSGPQELVRQSMAPLALVVLFVTVLAPLARLARHALCADPRPSSSARRAICAASSRWRKGCARGR